MNMADSALRDCPALGVAVAPHRIDTVAVRLLL